MLEVWLGGVFALCAAQRLRADGLWAHPAVLLPVTYGGIVLAPMTAYLYLAHPDWAWLYLLPASRVPRIAVIPAVAAAIAALIGGWAAIGRMIVLAVDRRRIAGALLAGALLAGVLAVLARARLGTVGSFADYHAGRALPLFSVKLGFVLVALAIGAAGAAAFVGAELRRDARRASVR